MLRIGEHAEYTGNQLEHRVSGRMTHLKLVGGCNEFATVPEGCCRLYRKEVDHCRDEKHHRGCESVP